MAFLLGVDTGGTYTDAVVFDDAAQTICAKAKAPTTHDDLAVGIDAAVESVLRSAEVEPSQIAMVSLSTTLATNALVEDKGRRACLIMIGFDQVSLDRAGLRAAVADDVLLTVPGGHSSYGDEAHALDLDDLARQIIEVAPSVDAFAVTSQFSVRNPSHEALVRDMIIDRTGKPVTCSHELSARLNGPKRGVTALLNARLIALVDELLAAASSALDARGIDAPIMVVRGNGSLVAAEFVRRHPIETILSGPAASVIGAMHLTGARDGLVVDVGGTTTDIAVLRGGMPDFVAEGGVVGGHHTMVEALAMHTHGIGGDSQVRVSPRRSNSTLLIGPRRVLPLSLAALHHQDVVQGMLERQLTAHVPGEFHGVLVVPNRYTPSRNIHKPAEVALRDALGNQPQPADKLLSSRVSIQALERLVSRGFVQLAGFTPTDAAHVLELQHDLDRSAAERGAELFARRRNHYGEPVASGAGEVSHLVIDTLVRRSSEALLDAALQSDGLPPIATTSELIAAALDGSASATSVSVGVAMPLVAIGAPAPAYYPRVADLLNTSASVPEHADVANAVGAVVGRVRIVKNIVVTSPRRGLYRVHLHTEPETFADLDEARLRAIEAAETSAVQEAKDAGGHAICIESDWVERRALVGDRPYFVEGTVTVTAAGRPTLAHIGTPVEPSDDSGG